MSKDPLFYQRKLVETSDGSHSLYVEGLNEHYHSVHGALQESQHVFIKMGYHEAKQGNDRLNIYELGFGTGLNALLTAQISRKESFPVHYTASEAYPLDLEEAKALNYGNLTQDAHEDLLEIHRLPWASPQELHPFFTLEKIQEKAEEHQRENQYDLIYFDAFAPEKQPELWEESLFAQMYRMLKTGGILTTYCAKGVVRRRMQAVGFEVERLQGPPGKREMLRARKLSS